MTFFIIKAQVFITHQARIWAFFSLAFDNGVHGDLFKKDIKWKTNIESNKVLLYEIGLAWHPITSTSYLITLCAVCISDASRSKKVENRARTRILDFLISENENAENFLDSKIRESRIRMIIEKFSRGVIEYANIPNFLLIAKFVLKRLKQ